MPKGKGLYTRKGASGRKMFFRDGKLISEKSYRTSLTRRSTGSRKRTTRSSPKRNNPRRNPSITGMAAGLSVAQYLNQGGAPSGGKGVIADIMASNLSNAFDNLADNAIALASTSKGKGVLTSAIVLATAGGLARKWFPSVKLGGTKLYFKI